MKGMYYIADIGVVDDDKSKDYVVIAKALIKEKDLPDFLKNLDSSKYLLLGLYGIGDVVLDYKKFLEQNKDLEHG